MKAGAVDFLLKPFSLDHLMTVVHKALEVRALRMRIASCARSWASRYDFGNIGWPQPSHAGDLRSDYARGAHQGDGAAGRRKRRRQGLDCARHPLPFPRRDRPFVKINCTSIPENLMEANSSAMKGRFTGANMAKPGKFELADTGTVMLDEIGDVPPSIQGEIAAHFAGARV